MLDFEKLDVYQCSLNLARWVFRVLPSLPRANQELGDQLRRAVQSIPLNIAEGAGKPTPKDRARFHAIARGSAMECAAVVDLMSLQGYLEPAESEEAKRMIVRLVAMLSRMCR